MVTLDQATLCRLKHERSHLQLALEDFSICYDCCSEKSTRIEIAKQLNTLNSRITEFDRVLAILHIKI